MDGDSHQRADSTKHKMDYTTVAGKEDRSLKLLVETFVFEILDLLDWMSNFEQKQILITSKMQKRK